MMLESLNTKTQPSDKHDIFNNLSVLPEAWYFAFRSEVIKPGTVRSLTFLNQRLVIFRSESGEVRALDAFCPHMGTDLSLGRVIGERIQCFFHRWEFNGKDGHCHKIPSLTPCETNRDMGLQSYPTCEKYGLIWVYAGESPSVPVLEVPDLEGKEIVFSLGRINRNRSHHHISMVNGLDAQHLNTVHGLSIQMEIEETTDHPEQIEFVLKGPTPTFTFLDRCVRFLFGPFYSYSMKYSQASVASLTLLRDVFFRGHRWPRLYMLYAYRPATEKGCSETQPIYVTLKRTGLKGRFTEQFLLWLTEKVYFFLKDEDDKIYDNIRFDSRRLLGIDRAVSKYIQFVNHLKPSRWT